MQPTIDLWDVLPTPVAATWRDLRFRTDPSAISLDAANLVERVLQILCLIELARIRFALSHWTGKPVDLTSITEPLHGRNGNDKKSAGHWKDLLRLCQKISQKCGLHNPGFPHQQSLSEAVENRNLVAHYRQLGVLACDDIQDVLLDCGLFLGGRLVWIPDQFRFANGEYQVDATVFFGTDPTGRKEPLRWIGSSPLESGLYWYPTQHAEREGMVPLHGFMEYSPGEDRIGKWWIAMRFESVGDGNEKDLWRSTHARLHAYSTMTGAVEPSTTIRRLLQKTGIPRVSQVALRTVSCLLPTNVSEIRRVGVGGQTMLVTLPNTAPNEPTAALVPSSQWSAAKVAAVLFAGFSVIALVSAFLFAPRTEVVDPAADLAATGPSGASTGLMPPSVPGNSDAFAREFFPHFSGHWTFSTAVCQGNQTEGFRFTQTGAIYNLIWNPDAAAPLQISRQRGDNPSREDRAPQLLAVSDNVALIRAATCEVWPCDEPDIIVYLFLQRDLDARLEGFYITAKGPAYPLWGSISESDGDCDGLQQLNRHLACSLNWLLWLPFTRIQKGLEHDRETAGYAMQAFDFCRSAQ